VIALRIASTWAADHVHSLACLALGQKLADARDGREAVVERDLGLLGHALVGLGKVLAPLRVSEDDVRHADVFEHPWGDLACERAFLLEVHVLGSDCDGRALGRADSCREGREGGATRMSLGRACRTLLDLLDKGLGLASGLVHLPVARDQLASHQILTS